MSSSSGLCRRCWVVTEEVTFDILGVCKARWTEKQELVLPLYLVEKRTLVCSIQLDELDELVELVYSILPDRQTRTSRHLFSCAGTFSPSFPG